MADNNKNTRRYFLGNGLKLGLATALGSIGLAKYTSKLNANTDNSTSEKME